MRVGPPALALQSDGSFKARPEESSSLCIAPPAIRHGHVPHVGACCARRALDLPPKPGCMPVA